MGPGDQEVKMTSWSWALAQREIAARAMEKVLMTRGNDREATSPHSCQALVATEKLVMPRNIMCFESLTDR